MPIDAAKKKIVRKTIKAKYHTNKHIASVSQLFYIFQDPKLLSHYHSLFCSHSMLHFPSSSHKFSKLLSKCFAFLWILSSFLIRHHHIKQNIRYQVCDNENSWNRNMDRNPNSSESMKQHSSTERIARFVCMYCIGWLRLFTIKLNRIIWLNTAHNERQVYTSCTVYIQCDCIICSRFSMLYLQFVQNGIQFGIIFAIQTQINVDRMVYVVQSAIRLSLPAGILSNNNNKFTNRLMWIAQIHTQAQCVYVLCRNAHSEVSQA